MASIMVDKGKDNQLHIFNSIDTSKPVTLNTWFTVCMIMKNMYVTVAMRAYLSQNASYKRKTLDWERKGLRFKVETKTISNQNIICIKILPLFSGRNWWTRSPHKWTSGGETGTLVLTKVTCSQEAGYGEDISKTIITAKSLSFWCSCLNERLV